jgi:hypothetical protein
MASANNIPSASLPTLTAIESLVAEDPGLEGEARLAENLEVPEALEEPDPAENCGPALAPPALPTLSETALYGLAGQAVRSLALYTEADPAAILLQFLAAFGNMAGPAPHCVVGSARHGLNLFVVLVGESGKARKGTSWRQMSSLFNQADPLWVARRVTAARPTAYRILHALGDEHPPTDRRLFLLAEEFASVLHLLGQSSGQLSPLLRSAWDGGNLYAHNGTHLLCASNAHFSMVAHITPRGLAHHLTRTEAHCEFANRCLWTSVRRSQSPLDDGGLPAAQLSAVAHELRRALHWTQSQSEFIFGRTEAASLLWHERYPVLSQARPDVYQAATSRAEAQVSRLSAIYAALDRSAFIEPFHLQAALAVWDYCQASARLFFDAAPIDLTARRISEALDASPQGLTGTQIRALFHRQVTRTRIDLALEQLRALGFINGFVESGRGRPSTLWTTAGATRPAGYPNFGA